MDDGARAANGAGRPHDPAGGAAPDPGLADRDITRRLHPAVALRPGRFDPVALLVVWYLRRSFVPLLMLGIVIATVLGAVDATERALDPTNPMSLLRALFSPWVGFAAAFIVRGVASAAGLLLAFPLTHWARPEDYRVGDSEGRGRAFWDRWKRTAAYRSLRWTWPVRRLAAERLGRDARWLLAMDRAWIIGGIVAGLAFPVAVLTT